MHHHTKLIATAALFASLGMFTPAMAAPFVPGVTPLSTYPTCEIPRAVVGAKTYYIDPVKGSPSGDGSAARPWQSLATVINSKVATSVYKTPYLTGETLTHNAAVVPLNPTAPVKAGDTILLMSGDYGNVAFKGVNTDFITVKAAPGQTPKLGLVSFAGSGKWILQGVKVQKEATGFSPLIAITMHGFTGAVSNIIIDGNTVSARDDVSGWSQADWQAKRAWFGINTDAGAGVKHVNCVAITNNKIINVKHGAGISSSKVLFAGNTIDTFGGDGIDIGGNDLLVTKNLITNPVNIGDGDHPDCIQGQLGRTQNYTNVVIDRNMCQRISNPNLKFPGALQGISAFDSDWNNLTLTNNIVITDTFHGMTWASIHGGLIANNTIINDGLTSNTRTWLSAGGKTHKGKPSNDVIVRNNLVKELLVTPDPVAKISADRNITPRFVYVQNGRTVYQTAPGTYFDNTVVSFADFDRQFKQFTPASLTYDVSLLGTSPAVNKGNTTLAPATDFIGASRVGGVDVGAMELQTAAPGAVPPPPSKKDIPRPSGGKPKDYSGKTQLQ